MPHLIIHVSSKGAAAISAHYGGRLFMKAVEELVATQFNAELGEKQIPGETVKTDGLNPSETMPVDVHLTVLAWKTPDRMLFRDRLEERIDDRLRKIWPGSWTTTLQAHLVIVG